MGKQFAKLPQVFASMQQCRSSKSKVTDGFSPLDIRLGIGKAVLQCFSTYLFLVYHDFIKWLVWPFYKRSANIGRPHGIEPICKSRRESIFHLRALGTLQQSNAHPSTLQITYYLSYVSTVTKEKRASETSAFLLKAIILLVKRMLVYFQSGFPHGKVKVDLDLFLEKKLTYNCITFDKLR